VKAQLVGLVGVHRPMALLGADHVAHGATDTTVGRVGFLTHTVVGRVGRPRRLHEADRRLDQALANTPSSMAFTGQTAVHFPQRVQVALSHRICQGRSLTLSELGVMVFLAAYGNLLAVRADDRRVQVHGLKIPALVPQGIAASRPQISEENAYTRLAPDHPGAQLLAVLDHEQAPVGQAADDAVRSVSDERPAGLFQIAQELRVGVLFDVLVPAAA